MTKRQTVRVGVEWVDVFPEDEPGGCAEVDLILQGALASDFRGTMAKWGHQSVFAWGNSDVWQSDFEPPERPGGDSLAWVDDVHFFYYADHGANWVPPSGPYPDTSPYFDIGFAKQHPTCATNSHFWRLGIKTLKWAVFDACDLVGQISGELIASTWFKAFQGVHLVMGFVGGVSVDAFSVQRASRFAGLINGSFFNLALPVGPSWLEAAWGGSWVISGGWTAVETITKVPFGTVPIVLASGMTRGEAEWRRDNETLNERDLPTGPALWIAYRWRE